MNLFLKDIKNSQLITWDLLIDEVNNVSNYNPFCKSSDYFTVFKQIVISLVLGEEIILLDSDFTESELINLTGFSEFNDFFKHIDRSNLPFVRNKEELIQILNNSPKSWKLTLFTSGTTGIPKKVSHSFKSITRFVKISNKNINNVWGFAYNPTHMAGVQVFFQALLNGNSIIRIFQLNTDQICNEINLNSITHISSTPTFYRLLVSCNMIFKSVERITSGGEKFNKSIFEQLNKIFPNAKITNVYASTEAGTLFASCNEFFSIKPEYEHLIKIENNEIFVHKSLIGINDILIDEWYSTGDMIEILSEKPLQFSFVNRKSDMINVGGYKVNPIEVEEAILSYEGVKNVIVYAKTNSVLGNILCCDIEKIDKNIDESSIRTFLKTKIQEFKIPRFISFVEEIKKTRTGKIKRN